MIHKLIETVTKKDYISKVFSADGFPADNALEIRVYYDLGGVSWATGINKQRGYYLSVTPLTYTPESRMVRAFAGTYMFIAPASRLSSRTLESYAKELLKDTDPLQGKVADVMADVVAKAVGRAKGGRDEGTLDDWRQWLIEYLARKVYEDVGVE